MNKRKVSKAWTKEEDALLTKGVEEFKGKNWKGIAGTVGSRSHTQCFQRWHKVVNPELKKGRWTKDEDQKLLQLAQRQMCQPSATTLTPTSSASSVDQFQYNPTLNSSKSVQKKRKISWGLVSKNIDGRTAKQCRERWMNNVNPEICRDEWRHEEDEIIRDLLQKFPNRWALIAKHLKGRTENAVKMRCMTLKRTDKRLKRSESSSVSISSASTVAESSELFNSTSLIRSDCLDLVESKKCVVKSDHEKIISELKKKMDEAVLMSKILEIWKLKYILETSPELLHLSFN